MLRWINHFCGAQAGNPVTFLCDPPTMREGMCNSGLALPAATTYVIRIAACPIHPLRFAEKHRQVGGCRRGLFEALAWLPVLTSASSAAARLVEHRRVARRAEAHGAASVGT